MKKLILLASLMICAIAGAKAPVQMRLPQVKETFGGVGAEIYVLEDMSAILKFDCAHGDVQAGRWPLAQSRINAIGTYQQETGARPRPGLAPRAEKAVYAATIDNSSGKMTLSVKVGKLRPVIYHLVAGQDSVLKRCM